MYLCLVKKTITIEGTIVFDPKDYTKKHAAQGKWKRIAMVDFNGDICQYYAWFIEKRYNLKLNMPLRKAHVTFINDRAKDMNGRWEEVKKKYHGRKIHVTLDIVPKTDSDKDSSTCHWWLAVPETCREDLHGIRRELGLGRPYWGLHLTIGYANEKNRAHSKYIHRNIMKYEI